MRAAYYEKNGKAAEVLMLGTIDPQEPGHGEVRVRLETSGINPSDVKSRAGRPPAFARIIPHSDGAGVIEAVGAGVAEARIGERVWIWNGQWKRAFGTASETITLPARQAVRLPDHIDFNAGALLGIPALTAFHAVTLAGPLLGRTVIVTGAASSVGHYAVQMAKRAGARVIGTASANRRAVAEEAGCDSVVDYKSGDVGGQLRQATGGLGADGLIDMDLSSSAALLPAGVLAPHGRHVCYGSNVAADIPISFPAMLWNSLTLSCFVVYELTDTERDAAISGLTSLLEDDALTHRVAETFALDDIVAAHEAVEKGRHVGNIVLACR